MDEEKKDRNPTGRPRRSSAGTRRKKDKKCPDQCGKTRFLTEDYVKLFCVKLALGGKQRTWYYSKECGCYHVTSKMNGRNKHTMDKYLPD